MLVKEWLRCFFRYEQLGRLQQQLTTRGHHVRELLSGDGWSQQNKQYAASKDESRKQGIRWLFERIEACGHCGLQDVYPKFGSIRQTALLNMIEIQSRLQYRASSLLYTSYSISSWLFRLPFPNLWKYCLISLLYAYKCKTSLMR